MAYETLEVGSRDLAFGPAPADFDMTPFDAKGRDAASRGERGTFWWLSDTRVDLSAPTRIYTSRVIQQVTSAAGLQSAANFEIVFNPAFEQVTIHAVRVQRDGSIRDAADPAAFEVLRRELNLERNIYDGRLTAHMIIPDVRIGDVVETCYSVKGSHPVLRGAFGHFVRLQWSSPTFDTRYRLIAGENRPLKWTLFGDAPEPVQHVEKGLHSLEWRMIDALPYRHEADTPTWWVGYSAVQVADAMAWSDVADLFREAYAAGPLPHELERAVDGLRSRSEDPARWVADALRLVQREIRYHSIGIGEGGFIPRALESIWATRYGDCKDMSRLLAAMLCHLGVNAYPALVNTQDGPALAQRLPTPLAFNHCVVCVRLDERSYWLDPTFPLQMGRLDHIRQAPDDWALPLKPEASLEAIPRRPVELIWDAKEHWRFARSVDEPAELTIRTVHRLERADDMRRWIADDGLENMSRNMREALEEAYGELTESAPLEVFDDDESNTLDVVEHYRVVRPFSLSPDGVSATFTSRDDIIGPIFRTPESVRRREPVSLGIPRRLRVVRDFDFPVTPAISPWAETLSSVNASALNAFEWLSDRKGRHTLDVTVEAPWVEAEDAADHFRFVRQARQNNGFSTTLTVKGGKIQSVNTGQTGWKSWAVVMCLVIAFALWRTYAAS